MTDQWTYKNNLLVKYVKQHLLGTAADQKCSIPTFHHNLQSEKPIQPRKHLALFLTL